MYPSTKLRFGCLAAPSKPLALAHQAWQYICMPSDPEEHSAQNQIIPGSPLPPAVQPPSTHSTNTPSYPPASWILRDEDDLMPIDRLHDKVDRLLVDVLQSHIESLGLDASVGSNIAVRWDEKHKNVGSDPDLYWQEPALPDDQTSILTWEGKPPPKLVIEIVSQDTADCDYLEKPAIYQAAGVLEFWILDLKHLGPALDSSGHKIDKRTLRRKGPKKPVAFGPYSLQVYSRDNQGGWSRSYAGEGPAFSPFFNAWVIVRNNRVRLSHDPLGQQLWPTGEERERSEKERALASERKERAEKERALANEKREREAKEREREAKEAALNELAELKKKLGLS